MHVDGRRTDDRQLRRWAECVILFVVIPMLFFFRWVSLPLIPSLFLISVCAAWVLIRDRTFDRRQLWRIETLGSNLKSILGLFVTVALLLGLYVVVFEPTSLLGFVRRQPVLWGIVMILYPLLSVYPQELLCRSFFFHRYRGLFRSSTSFVVFNALCFASLHIVFYNWISIVLTFLGGVLFAQRYRESRSLAVVTFEHALYGCFIFTIGLGRYFYSG